MSLKAFHTVFMYNKLKIFIKITFSYIFRIIF